MNPFGNPATLAHLHLLINHVPTIGTVLAIGLFLLALVRDSPDLTVAGLGLFYLIALGSVPAYISGVAAHAVLQGRDGVSEAAIAAHQSAALIALGWMEITGVVSWFGLWQWRRQGRATSATLGSVLGLSVASIATMAWAANLGGFIRHPEIALSTADLTPAKGFLDVPAMGEWVLAHMWMWPTGETLHFIGMSLSFGVLLVVNLYLLGFAPNVPFASIHRLLPWGMLGLILNVATGMMFFTGVPRQYLENPTFHWKVFFLVLVGLNYLYLTVFERPWHDASAPGRARFADKALAFASLFTWVAVMYLGRMLPYLRGLFER